MQTSVLLQSKPNNKELLHLSVSKTKTFASCPAKFRFCYIERLPKKDWEHLIFGKFIHEVLEKFHKKLMEGYLFNYNILMTECFKSAFENWKEKLNKEQFLEIKEILGEYLIIMKQETPNVIGVEKSFYINVDDKILINGFIDRIQLDKDNVLHVADYKSSKVTSVKYLEKDFFQLLTYAFVMCLEDPSLEKVRTSYIIMKNKFQYITKEFSRKEIMDIENQFIDYAKKINEEKLFRPNTSPLCESCDYLDLCDEGTAFVDILEKRRNKSNKNNFSFGKEDW